MSSPCPSFDVATPDGRRHRVRPTGPEVTIGELADHLGLPACDVVSIDGRPVPRTQPLGSTSVRHGSEVSAAHAEPVLVDVGAAPTVEVAVVSGPSCTGWTTLGAGRHLTGRSPVAAVHVDDAGVEPFHGVLVIGPDGAVTFAQLTGRVPVLVDDRPVDGTVGLGPGAELSLGSSRVAIRITRRHVGDDGHKDRDNDGRNGPRPVSSDPRLPTRDPWRRPVVRGRPIDDQPAMPALHVPEPPAEHRSPPATGLIGAIVGLVGSGAMAILLGQLLFAMFGVLGATASFATWAVGAVGAARARRRSERAAADDAAAFADDLASIARIHRRLHIERHPTIVDVLDQLDAESVWERRLDAGSPLCASIGTGVHRRAMPLDQDGRRRLSPDLERALAAAECLIDVAVPVELWRGDAVALHGPAGTGASIARSVVVQLATAHGPADWRLAVVTDRPGDWAWATWLPHARTSAGGSTFIDVSRPGPAVGDLVADLATTCADGLHVLVVVDDPRQLATRTAPLRRLIATTDVTSLVAVENTVPVPAVCNRVIDVGVTGRLGAGAPCNDDAPDAAVADLGSAASDVRVAGIGVATAARAARVLAPLVDPEERGGGSQLPDDVRLGDIHALGDAIGGAGADVSAGSIARRWADTAGSDTALVVPVGSTADGIVQIDLVNDGPHGLIAGTTGSGKSELLRTLVVGLAAGASPERVTFVLVDYKGGATFDSCARLPHTVGLVTDLDDDLADRALVSLEAELRRRERLLRDVGVDDIASWPVASRAPASGVTERAERAVVEPLPRLVVVVDEFAALAKEVPGFVDALVGIAQRGRSLGIHLLLATQRPAGVITDDIRANTNLRLALRLNDTADAHDVVGDPAPAAFTRRSPGRAALRLGPDELVVFQTASCTGPERHRAGRLATPVNHDGSELAAHEAGEMLVEEGHDESALDRYVDAIVDAAAQLGLPPPHRPWLEPLPAHCVVADVEPLDGRPGIGIIDDPARQTRRPLRAPDGNLLLVGSIGSGTTTALHALAAHECRTADVRHCHVYVIDSRGDDRLTVLESAAHVGAVVRLTETERIDRLLRRLAQLIDQRIHADADAVPAVRLLIHGWEGLRTSLSSVDRAASSARLARIVAEGPVAGVTVWATSDGSSPGVPPSSWSDTWVFHTSDPALARGLGVRPVRAGTPGRLRVTSSGLAAQVAADAVELPQEDVTMAPPSAVAAGPAPIRILPDVVDPDRFDNSVRALPARPDDPGTQWLEVGLGAEHLEPDGLGVPTGDHVFVGGAARAGKTTALRQLTAAWRRRRPGGRIVTVTPGRSAPLESLCLPAGADAAGPTLVVVDDAERVDDPLLGELVASRRPDVTVVAAARLDAVRALYGHWTREVARSRCGVLLTSVGDVDGDLLGVTLPRRAAIPPRPGLAWCVDGRGHRLVQVAARLAP